MENLEAVRVVRLEESLEDLSVNAFLSSGDVVKITLAMQESRPMAAYWVSFEEKTGTKLKYTLVTPFERAEYILGLSKNPLAALHPWEVELAKRINQPKENTQ